MNRKILCNFNTLFYQIYITEQNLLVELKNHINANK